MPYGLGGAHPGTNPCDPAGAVGGAHGNPFVIGSPGPCGIVGAGGVDAGGGVGSGAVC